MPSSPSLTKRGCNFSTPVVLLSCLLGLPLPAGAQDTAAVWRFFAGGAAGLGLHEAGHVLMNVATGTRPGLDGVKFGPIPFFAITHERVGPQTEFVISSAGFWTQHASSEVILSRHPDLRERRAPVLKGVLAFNVLASGAYAAAAFGRFGPLERDTRGMAGSADLREPIVGAWVLTPAVLDAARYYTGDPAWLRWASRAAKMGGVLLVLRAGD